MHAKNHSMLQNLFVRRQPCDFFCNNSYNFHSKLVLSLHRFIYKIFIFSCISQYYYISYRFDIVSTMKNGCDPSLSCVLSSLLFSMQDNKPVAYCLWCRTQTRLMLASACYAFSIRWFAIVASLGILGGMGCPIQTNNKNQHNNLEDGFLHQFYERVL